MFSHPDVPRDYMVAIDQPPEFYATSGDALNRYRVALGVEPLTEEQIAAIPRTADGLLIVSNRLGLE